MGAGALECPPVNVMNMLGPVEADRNRDVAALETVEPSIVDQHAVGGDRNGYIAAGSRGDRLTCSGDAMEILNSPQQRLAAMQDDREFNQMVLGDMLLDALQQLLQHLGAHQLGLVVDGCVTKPVAIGAIDVAPRCDLDQHLRDRLILENVNIPIVSQHANTTPDSRKNSVQNYER